MEKFDFREINISSRIICENELAFAFLTNIPIVPGHTLICPKQHLTFSHELTSEIWSDLFKLKEVVCYKLQQALNTKGFNFAWNEGSIAGQSVPHFHLHVVPRKENDSGIVEYEPRVFLYRPGSRAVSPKDELISFSKLLREINEKDEI